jgi:hypothetical protein
MAEKLVFNPITGKLDLVNDLSAYATIDYVDSGTWLMPPIIEWYDPVAEGGLPVAPTIGDRYGADDTGFGWTIDYIYEWDGTTWVESAPEEGWMLWDLWGMMFWAFFSGGWMEVGEYSFLKLDQSTPQTIINGAPRFSNGLVIKSGQKLIFDGA